MRVTTLKAAKGRLGGLLAYYAGLAEDRSRSGPARGPVDYYLDPNEPPGRWWGRGRHGLGLDGEVTGEQLRAVLEGRHPSTGRPLGRRFGDASARGFDATFSAPKSVSVLWAVCPGRVGAGRGPRRPRRRRRCRPRLPGVPWGGDPEGQGRGGPGRHQGSDRGGVPSAHVAVDGPAAAHPRGHRRQGPRHHRPVVVARCPVPEAPATHHRLGLRRRPPHRAHQPPRRGVGADGQRPRRHRRPAPTGAGGVLEADRPGRRRPGPA